jgi:hypothetical protein
MRNLHQAEEEAMGRPVPDEVAAQIRAAILAGRKIEAIKLYRQASGEGLKEAKEFVEAVQAELRRTEPESFTAPAGKGCGTTAALFIVLFAALFATFL